MKKISNKAIMITIAICSILIITGSQLGFDCWGYYECLNWYGWIAFSIPTVAVLFAFVLFVILPIISTIKKK